MRKAARFTFEDIHRAIFARPRKPIKLEELKRAIARHVKEKHARD